MGRRKKVLKPKEPIRLRDRLLKNGNRSLYLDIYENGIRKYEYLKLYLVPQIDEASRIQNENTLRAANAIKYQRVLEHTNGVANIKQNIGVGKMLLTDWLQVVREKRAKYGSSLERANTFRCVIGHINEYLGGKRVRLCDIDKQFLLGFIDYLSKAGKRNGKKNAFINQRTARDYYNTLKSAFRAAIREGYVLANPFERISDEELKPITPPQADREYLTIEEVKALQKVVPYNELSERVKQAFLFSCFTGLRISDVRGLTWGDMRQANGRMEIAKTMKKTHKKVYVPLSDIAARWLPQVKKESTSKVFNLPTASPLNIAVKKLCEMAGVTKKVCFHTARHTFATMCLTSGADIYTTSKLLGHSKVTTTQIYADIINQKKVDAVNMISDNFKD